jgi:CheY-like chemotaxis protein
MEAEDRSSASKHLDNEGVGVDLVFSDAIMPSGMNGFELARKLRRRYPHIKVLLTSGYPEKIIDKGGIGGTGITLLRKPYKKAHLAEAVRTALDQ